MALKRLTVLRPYELPAWFDNKPPKDWDLGYEMVVSFQYGLDEAAISRVARLRNYDTGITMCGPQRGVRDLMFPCGLSRDLAHAAANRLVAADVFGALRIKISYPVEHKGKDSWTPWYDASGRLIERVKHRRKAFITFRKTFGTANGRRKARRLRAGGKQ
jgi:hypothetical protein